MMALKYYQTYKEIAPANVLTEFVNNTVAKLNEDEPVRGDGQPYWELELVTLISADELLYTFVCWSEAHF